MVETFTQRTVQASGQTPGYLGVNYTPDAFGASVGRAMAQFGGEISNLGKVMEIADNQKKQNDLQNVMNEARSEIRPTLFDQEQGIYAQKGKNALDSMSRAKLAYDEIKQKKLDSIEDPQMKDAWEKAWNKETEDTLDKTAIFQMREYSNYKVETAKATLGQAVIDSYNQYNDPEAIKKAQESALGVIDMNSAGLDPTGIAVAKQEAKSQIALAALSRWAVEDPDQALKFYEDNKDDFSGQDHVVATKFIGVAKDTRDAQVDFARIKRGNTTGVNDVWNRLKSAESSNNPNVAPSKDGALGIAQVMPDTARSVLAQLNMLTEAGYSDKQLQTLFKDQPKLAEKVGRTYFEEQLTAFGGDVEAALVAYNAGPERAKAFLTHNVGKRPGERDYNIKGMEFLKKETEPYVQKILGGASEQTPAGYRMTETNWDLKNFQPDDLMAPTARWVDARAAKGLDNLAGVMKARFPGLQFSVNEKNSSSNTAGKRRGTSDPKDNPHVAKSEHLNGAAFDIQSQGWTDEQKAAAIVEARKLGFKGFGFYGADGHLHFDMGKERTWGPVPDWAKEALKTPIGDLAEAPIQVAAAGNEIQQLPTTQTIGRYVSAKDPDLNSMLMEADTIADPGRRTRVKAMLREDAAQTKADNEQQLLATKNEAWGFVLGGGKIDKLPIQMQQALGPEFLAQMQTYTTNRAKGEMPMDWKAWTDFNGKSPEELAKVDVMEYRNKLDDSHFDRAVELARSARDKANGKQGDDQLHDNARTASQIIGDMTAAQGWKSSTTSGALSISKFAANMDQRILAEQQAKGQKLTAVEIQDIADKLLIEDKYSAFFSGNQGQATDVENPDQFQAASSWEDIQRDDQETVMAAYTRYYGPPAAKEDLEKVTDHYNRAMVVWLGGKPTGPEDELVQQRALAEKAYKRKLTDQEFEKTYGKWLLTFLGR